MHYVLGFLRFQESWEKLKMIHTPWHSEMESYLPYEWFSTFLLLPFFDSLAWTASIWHAYNSSHHFMSHQTSNQETKNTAISRYSLYITRVKRKCMFRQCFHLNHETLVFGHMMSQIISFFPAVLQPPCCSLHWGKVIACKTHSHSCVTVALMNVPFHTKQKAIFLKPGKCGSVHVWGQQGQFLPFEHWVMAQRGDEKWSSSQSKQK